MVNNIEDIRNVGIIGAGLMGHGIAQAFAVNGYRVKIFDDDRKALKSVPDRIRQNLQVFLKLKKVKKSDIDKCISHIDLCEDLASVCDNVDFLIEAIKENLEAKVSLFEEMEKSIDSNVIVSSNTSAISITRLSDGLRHKQRFLGTHFWNPPHIIPCVEVIRGEYTSDTVFDTTCELMKRIGKEPVKVLKDVPGFLGNRLQHAMWREAISLVEKKIASPEDIDNVVKYGFGLRLSFIGPLETADLAGLDLDYDIHKYLFPYLENSSAPSPVLKGLVDQGVLGVKTGSGFYEWSDEKIDRIIKQRDSILLKIMDQLS